MVAKVEVLKIEGTELKRWIDEQRSFVLLDVLTADAYAETHLPGARNACIYEVSFLDQVGQHAKAPDDEIVVYCSSPSSRASTDAAVRLVDAGYTKVYEFEGGREAWQAADYPFEGTKAVWEPVEESPVRDRDYAIDPDRSVVEWTGRNIGGRHFGTIRVASGNVAVQEGALAAGGFELDMRSIEVGDLTGEMAQLLVEHLLSADFFAVDEHPTARFEITGLSVLEGATPGAPNHHVRGRLTLRGVTEEVAFPAVVASKGEELALDAHFDIDRTRWGVDYGSGKFYDRLGMHLVNDDVSLQVRVIAR
ncbi:MAG: YceI family protein [Planctomycetota bacterium]|jgi:rhodanese-related sulfurtransferase